MSTGRDGEVRRQRRRSQEIALQDLGPVERRERRRARRGRRTAAIVLVALLAICCLAASAGAVYLHASSNLSAAAPLTPAGHAVIFIIQGVGPGDLDLRATPHLAALASQGVNYRDAWVGQAEPLAVPSLATVGTGSYPRVDGVVGREWSDPAANTVVHLNWAKSVEDGQLAKVMSGHPLPSLTAEIKQHDPIAAVVSVSGTGCGAEAAGTPAADVILCPRRAGQQWVPAGVPGHPVPPALQALQPVSVAAGPQLAPAVEGWYQGQEDDWVARYAILALHDLHPRLTIVTFPEVENLVHFVSAEQRPALVRRLLIGIDGDIGKVMQELRRDGTFRDTVFVVTSDAPVAPIHAAVSESGLQDAVAMAGGQALYLDVDMSAMIGLQDPLQAQPVAQALQAAALRRVDAIYYKVPTGNGWSYQAQYLDPDLPGGFDSASGYLLWTMASRTSPDVVVIFRPGTSARTETIGGYHWSEGSLGLEWDSMRVPLIVSGHGVPPGVDSHYPARLVDIAPTVEALMGLTPAGNGVVLAQSMFRPSAALLREQKQAAAWLSPLVQALQQRAQQTGG